jgi:Holliday junction resolvasome RuvABC endonuclease subunit
MDNILALDLGTTMGWAMRENGKVLSGSVSFKPTRSDNMNCRYTRFRRWLNENHCSTFDDVVYELVMRHNGTIAGQTYGGFMATLQMWCDAQGIPYEGVPVGTIKKFATGNGNATKLDMVNAMERRGHKPQDDNEADALALLYWRVERGEPIHDEGEKKEYDNTVEADREYECLRKLGYGHRLASVIVSNQSIGAIRRKQKKG